MGVDAGAKAPLNAVARMGQDLTKAGQFDLVANAPEIGAGKELANSSSSLNPQLSQAKFPAQEPDRLASAEIAALNQQLAKSGRIDLRTVAPGVAEAKAAPAKAMSPGLQLAQAQLERPEMMRAPQAVIPTEAKTLSKQVAEVRFGKPDIKAVAPQLSTGRALATDTAPASAWTTGRRSPLRRRA